MSIEQILIALKTLGLSETDAEVYIFLAPKAPQRARDIADALKMKKKRLYPCLRNLLEKGIVTCTEERPKLFSAIPIEEALSQFINANLDEVQHMEENREKILSLWRSMTKENKNSP